MMEGSQAWLCCWYRSRCSSPVPTGTIKKIEISNRWTVRLVSISRNETYHIHETHLEDVKTAIPCIEASSAHGSCPPPHAIEQV